MNLLDWIEKQEEVETMELPPKPEFYVAIQEHEALGTVQEFLEKVMDNGGYDNLPDK